MLNTFLIAIGLAMDAFAVSISSGIPLKKSSISYYLTFGLVFGVFQFIMPIFGYYGSQFFSYRFAKYADILSFTLLFIIGAKMLFESLSQNEYEEKHSSASETIPLTNILMLGIATSIDAFAVGIVFQINNEKILLSSVIIGIVAFSFSFVGVYLGKKIGNLVGNKAEILGGVILIFLSFKFLLT